MKKSFLLADDSKPGMSRRFFMQSAAVCGVTLGISPVLAHSAAASTNQGEKPNDPVNHTQRTLGRGNAAMIVSALGFGVMGLNYHRGPHPDRQAATRLLHQAVEHGITLFDTAESYGPYTNEALAGEALSQFRGKIAVTTKFGHEFVNGKRTGKQNSRPEHIRQVAETSLRRLKIETIELFYQHRLDRNVPIEDVAGTVKDLIQEGKVRHFGLCEVSAEAIRKAHAIQPLTAIQSEYHLMWREPEKEVLPICEELGIGFVPYSPLNRGLLGGKLNEFTNFNNGNDNRNTLPRFQPEAIRQNLRFVEAMTEFGRIRGMTSAQLALIWLLAKKPWIVPIPGTSKLSHLEENIRAQAFLLTQEDIIELESKLAAIPIIGDRYPAEQQRLVGQ